MGNCKISVMTLLRVTKIFLTTKHVKSYDMFSMIVTNIVIDNVMLNYLSIPIAANVYAETMMKQS